MSRGNGRSRLALMVGLTLLLPVAQAAVGSDLRWPLAATSTAQGTELSEPSYLQARAAHLGTIAADPREAARSLVGAVLGPDAEAAQVGTIELLRRAAIATINLDGAVVAVPDRYLLWDAAMLGEYLGNLTASVRRNDGYTFSDVGSILVDAELFAGEPDLDTLLGAIAGWGKAADVPAESTFAGMAFRELGARRGNVYHQGVDPTEVRVDLLQLTLLVAHLAADTRELADPVEASAPLAAAAASAQQECRKLYDALQLKPPSDGTQHTVRDTLIRDALMQALEKVDEAGIRALKEGMRKVDIVSKALNTIAFLAAVRLDVAAEPASTHFGHGRPGQEVTVTATARWEQNEMLQELRCLQGIVGVNTRANGPMPGLRVRWRLDGPRTSVKGSSYGRGAPALMRAKRGQGQEFSPTGLGGQLSGADGTASVVLEPRIERSPGAGAEMRGKVTVTASLDKDEVPDALKLFLGNRTYLYDVLKGKGGWATTSEEARKAAEKWSRFLFDQLYDIALKAIQKAGLPSRPVTIDVGYHGSDVYVIQEVRRPFLWLYVAELGLELYTCDGLEGRWRGVAQFEGDKTAFGSLLERFAGRRLPQTVSKPTRVDAFVDLRSGHGELPLMPPMNLRIDLDTVLIDKGAYGVVGTAEPVVDGQSMSILMVFDAVPEYLVERVRPDLMGERLAEACGQNEAEFP